MQEKLKQLELLVTQLLARQKETAAQNHALKQRLRIFEGQVDKLKSVESELKAVRECKKNAQTVLKRLAGRLDKEIAKAREEEKKIV
jgi:peptidoglycan hydrolase CwlO-like protein